MIGYRLSRTGLAAHPYYITSVGVGIWSIEELCFFLCNNPALVDEQVVSLQLVRWLDEEFHLTTIATGLERGIRRGERPGELAIPLLRGVGYLDTQELKKLMRVFESLETGGPGMRLKLKGDALLKNGLYGEAATAYRQAEDLLGRNENALRAQIFHNLGVAFMQTLSYEEGIQAFRKAYGIDKTPERLRILLLALGLAKPEEAFQKEARALEAEEELLTLVQETLTAVREKELALPEDPAKELERIRFAHHREAGA